MKNKIFAILLLGFTTLLTGCATSRSEIKLALAPAEIPTKTQYTSKNKAVWIRTVIDERQFELAPKDPSIPSLGFEGSTQASSEIKARAFGRKRNGFGAALGDVLLADGQTVSTIVREQLSIAFTDAGYKIAKNEAEAGSAPLFVDVHVKKFWAWINMGFWTLTLNNQITTDLVMPDIASQVTVNVHLKEQHMAITDGVWAEDLSKALAAYREQATIKLGQLPLEP